MSERAKQFMPFDALKGFKEALRAKEKLVVEKKELSDDDVYQLNEALSALKKGMLVEASYYADGEYILQKGIVTKLNKSLKYLVIVKTKIEFDSLQSLIIEENKAIN